MLVARRVYLFSKPLKTFKDQVCLKHSILKAFIFKRIIEN